MDTSKATARPWHWGDGWKRPHNTRPGDPASYAGCERYMRLQLFGPNDEEIIPIRIDHFESEWDCDENCEPPTAADRAFILRAVNSFDALLAACKSALHTAKHEHHPFRQWQDECRAAIREAETDGS